MTLNNQRRVVLTGLGSITNLGHDVMSTWTGLLAGRSGISEITAFEQDNNWTTRIAGEIRDWDPTDRLDHGEIKKMDRFSQLAVWAAAEAMEDSGLDWSQGDPYRRGVVLGSGVGGIQTIEFYAGVLRDKGPRRMSPFTVPQPLSYTHLRAHET